MLLVMRRIANSGGATAYAAMSTTSTDINAGIGVGFSGTDLFRHAGTPSSLNTSALGVTTADGWVCCGWSKPAGTPVTPRAHKFVYATGVASHENAVGTLDPGTTVPARLVFGRFGVAATAPSNSSFAAVVTYARELTDDQCTLAAQSLTAMMSLNPVSLILFDGEAAAPIDLILGGPIIASAGTPTIDSQSPPLSYGRPIF